MQDFIGGVAYLIKRTKYLKSVWSDSTSVDAEIAIYRWSCDNHCWIERQKNLEGWVTIVNQKMGSWSEIEQCFVAECMMRPHCKAGGLLLSMTCIVQATVLRVMHVSNDDHGYCCVWILFLQMADESSNSPLSLPVYPTLPPQSPPDGTTASQQSVESIPPPLPPRMAHTATMYVHIVSQH